MLSDSGQGLQQSDRIERHRTTGQHQRARESEADADQANGASVAEICEKLEVAENTYSHWRNECGGIKADEIRRLQEPEKEIARFKALVADLSLNTALVNEPLWGIF